MKIALPKNIIINEHDDDDNIIFNELVENEEHRLKVDVSEKNKYVNLTFNSRIALYEFGKSLMQEAVYGDSGQQEFYSLMYNDKLHLVNGVRVSEGSSRIFIFYPKEK